MWGLAPTAYVLRAVVAVARQHARGSIGMRVVACLTMVGLSMGSSVLLLTDGRGLGHHSSSHMVWGSARAVISYCISISASSSSRSCCSAC